jgi:hypothetical protein
MLTFPGPGLVRLGHGAAYTRCTVAGFGGPIVTLLIEKAL